MRRGQQVLQENMTGCMAYKTTSAGIDVQGMAGLSSRLIDRKLWIDITSPSDQPSLQVPHCHLFPLCFTGFLYPLRSH